MVIGGRGGGLRNNRALNPKLGLRDLLGKGSEKILDETVLAQWNEKKT